MHNGDPVLHGCVVQQIAGGEVVGAVDHDVVALDDPIDVRGSQTLLIPDDLHVGIQSLERSLRG